MRRESDGLYSLTVVCPHCRQTIRYGNYGISRAAMFSIMCYCRNCRRRFFIASNRWRLLAKTICVVDAVLPAAVKVEVLGGLFRAWRRFLRRFSHWPTKSAPAGATS